MERKHPMPLTLKPDTLNALFDGGFTGPAVYQDRDRFHVSTVTMSGDRLGFMPVEYEDFGFLQSDQSYLDLSVPWVHEHIAATCLTLLGVQGARAACMTQGPGYVYTLRWVGPDGLPYSATWRQDGSVDAVRQNDLLLIVVSHVPSKRMYTTDMPKHGRPIPRLTLPNPATHHDALEALIRAIDAKL